MAKTRLRSAQAIGEVEPRTNLKPTLYVGSSTEMLEMARVAQQELEDVAEVVVWTQGVFSVGETVLESMMKAAPSFDFALMFLEADDRVVSRGVESASPRDNMVFELGLLMGLLGRDRVYIIFNADRRPKIPTYIHGISYLTYRDANDKRAALGPACGVIRQKIQMLGRRPDQLVRPLGAEGA